VLNGLVLVSFARQLEDAGASPVDAITRTAELRLRPVLMTALVAALGFIPLGTVVLRGLATATLLTLFVLPVMYAYLGRPRRRGFA
jgi:cobalt-zinc-cadmium resistance protein CzcA